METVLFEGKRYDMPKMQPKKSVVCIGRFNPPTKGHGKVINTARSVYRREALDAIVVVVIEGTNTSEDKERNPLSGAQRIRYLEASTYGKGVKYLLATNAYEALVKVRQAGYEPSSVVGGVIRNEAGDITEDRATSYKNMLDKYFKTPEGDEIEHNAIQLERDPKADDVSGVSGSVARVAVKMGYFDEFEKMVSLDDPTLVRKMFDDIAKSIKGDA